MTGLHPASYDGATVPTLSGPSTSRWPGQRAAATQHRHSQEKEQRQGQSKATLWKETPRLDRSV